MNAPIRAVCTIVFSLALTVPANADIATLSYEAVLDGCTSCASIG